MKLGQIPTEMTNRRFYGATYLLDEIGNTLVLTENLKQCFSATYRQIQSIAYYMLLESESPLFRFEKWSTLHKHPYEKTISSKRRSELFTLQEKRRSEDEYWAYDTTSLSRYSKTLRQSQYGKN